MEVLALRIEGGCPLGAEARCGIRLAEPTHGIIALFDAAVVLLDAIVQVGTAALGDDVTQCFADGPWIRLVAIRWHAFGCLLSDF